VKKSTKRPARGQSASRSSDFPLWKHPSGRWCRKIKKRFHYFGHVADDPDGKQALEQWLAVKDDLLAGRTPRVQNDGLTVLQLCTRFLTAKSDLVESGELSARTLRQYHASADLLVRLLRADRLVTDLRPEDFTDLRAKLAKGRGPLALGSEITVVRMIFRFAYEQDLIERPIRYGSGFHRPTRKTIRQERARKGLRMFEAQELRAILDAAKMPLKALIYLGLNCAFGATDIANLPRSAIDLKRGWIDYPRPKTGIPRRIPLWPETIAALREAMEARPDAKDPADADLALLTRFGRRWVRDNQVKEGTPGTTPNDAVAQEFAKLLTSLNLKREGLLFYGLRHTFRTVADESGDQIATNAIMGHTDDSMAALYRERISDKRLRAVVDYVHGWLFGPSNETAGTNEEPEADEPNEVDEEPAILRFPAAG
jgi:integrase